MTSLLKAATLAAALVVLLAWIHPSDPGYMLVTPHPYWLAAIVAGVVLGLRGALAVGPVLAGAYLYFVNARADRSEVETILTATNLALPFFIVVVPAILGAITDRGRDERAELARDLARREKLVGDLETVNRSLSDERARVERRLATQNRTSARFFDQSRALETLDADDAARALVDLAREQIGEDNAYIYLREATDDAEDAYLRRVAYADPVATPLAERIPLAGIATTHPLLAAALDGRKVARMDEPQAAGEKAFCLAAPLVTLSDQVIGVIALRSVDFLNYIPPTFTLLESLGRWGGTCLGRARHISSMRESSLLDEQTGFFNHLYFTRRLEAQFNQARKHSLPLHQVRFEVPELATGDPLRKTVLAKLIADCIRGPARDVDVIARGRGVGEFHAILPIASEAEVASFVRAVQAEFSELQRQLRMDHRMTLRCYSAALRREQASVAEFLSSETPCS